MAPKTPIPRSLEPKLRSLADKFPVVTLTGPRQSGKTTLCRLTFADADYVSLEDPDRRVEATEDPRGFLSGFSSRVIIDEIQRVPQLASYIQTLVDDPNHGTRYVLTGSQNLILSQTVAQSLAGRSATLELLPFTYHELYDHLDRSPSIDDLLFAGFYPRIFDQKLSPNDALKAYVATYVERDVRQLANIRHLNAFEAFLGLCASNVGRLVNYTRFSNDIGVDQETIKSWLSVLRASYICFLLPQHHNNFRKRVVKSPKLYFYDVGLAAHLLRIRSASVLNRHPLRGALFENYVVADILKMFTHRGETPPLSFFRDHGGLEVDLLIDEGVGVRALEIKSGQTLSKDLFRGLERFAQMAGDQLSARYLVYGGQRRQGLSYATRVLTYSQLKEALP